MSLILRKIPRMLVNTYNSQACLFNKGIATGRQFCTADLRLFKGKHVLSSSDDVLLQEKPLFPLYSLRYMSSEQITDEGIENRVMSCLELYDKIKKESLTIDSEFTKDLGLDSLDHVEIIVAIENEFALEIPDAVADSLSTPRKIVEYISKNTGQSFEDRVKDLGTNKRWEP